MNKYLPQNPILDIPAFSKILKNTTNSYKYLFFLAILAKLSNPTNQGKLHKNEIKLIDIATEMLLIAWFPHNYFKLSFGVQDQFASILSKFLNSHEYNIDERSISQASISKLRNNLHDWLLQKKDNLKVILKYVPYRLLTPFFENELRGLLDSKKNSKIKELSEAYFDEKNPLYKFSDESILINKHWLNYIKNNFSIIEGWVKWEWCDYLQTRNPSVPAIPKKILPIFNRMSMDKETRFWTKILELEKLPCIYSSKNLSNGFSLDHFLPWTFVTHNQLWNLIPVNSSANSSKSNNLPDLERYFQEFIETQSTAIHLSKEIFPEKKWQKYMESYVSDLHLSSYVDVLDEVKLETAYKNTVLPLYEIAKSHGFGVDWIYLLEDKKKKISPMILQNEKKSFILSKTISNTSITDIQTIIEQNLIDNIPEKERYVSSLPVYPLEIAAGNYVNSEVLAYSYTKDDTQCWIDTSKINLFRSLDKGMFITQIHGHSMEPSIPDGSYCLFKYGVAGSRSGRVVLVQKSGYEDPETKASFTIKRYYSEKATQTEFEWQNDKIELRPDNKDYPILTIEPEEVDGFVVIAEFIQII